MGPRQFASAHTAGASSPVAHTAGASSPVALFTAGASSPVALFTAGNQFAGCPHSLRGRPSQFAIVLTLARFLTLSDTPHLTGFTLYDAKARQCGGAAVAPAVRVADGGRRGRRGGSAGKVGRLPISLLRAGAMTLVRATSSLSPPPAVFVFPRQCLTFGPPLHPVTA